MIYIGIDVAKDKREFHILTSNGEILVDNSSSQNFKESFEYFFNQVRKLCERYLSIVKIGLESTGHYSFNLLSFLKAQNLDVVEFNPLTVNQSRRATSLSRTKTDKNGSR